MTLGLDTIFEWRVFAADVEAARRTERSVGEVVRHVERLTSAWNPDSDLARLNASLRVAGEHATEPELARLLADCRDAVFRYDGCFDVAVGSLLHAYGYYAGEGRGPSPDALSELLRLVGPDAFRVSDSSVHTDRDGVRFDLGGVAKGYAVDRVAERLTEEGIERALISGGGSVIRARGAPPGEVGWTVELDTGGTEPATLLLRDQALATSGQLSAPVFVDGELASHIVDPRTGQPVDHATVTAYVLAATATEADMASTALLAMGSDAARDWFARLGDAAPIDGALLLDAVPGAPGERVRTVLGAWAER